MRVVAPHGKEYFSLGRVQTTFDFARAYCASLGGQLFQPATVEEFNWVTTHFNDWKFFWIGAKAENEFEYRYADGTLFALNGSLRYDPNGHYRGTTDKDHSCVALEALTKADNSRFHIHTHTCAPDNTNVVCEKTPLQQQSMVDIVQFQFSNLTREVAMMKEVLNELEAHLNRI